jgi:phosphohistidine phosphatase
LPENHNNSMTTRRILLLRHAKSAWGGAEDYERPLAPRGRRAAAVMGVYLRDEGLVPDLVLCSGALRARQTWDIVATALAARPPVEVDPQLYMVGPDRLLARLRRVPETVGTVIMVGHEGGVDDLARLIARPDRSARRRRLDEKFPTAALAVIAVAGRRWADLGKNAGRLERYAAPKDLV